MSIDPLAYYRGALWGLKFVEARRPTGRRFGPDADALWQGFAGDLSPADRLDLLIRDANAEWPGAFGARSVFDRRAVAEDDPFGVGWESLDGARAAELWQQLAGQPAPADARALLDHALALCAHWTLGEVAGRPLEPSALEQTWAGLVVRLLAGRRKPLPVP